MYETILVPLDGSELAEVPLNYAKELAARSGAEVILLHVCGTAECHCTPEGCHVQPMHRVYVEHTAEVLRRRLGDAGAGEASVDCAIVAGDPATEILRYAEENQVGLVVMATHGRSGLSRWVMGSIAARVICHSHAPVRLVRSLRHEETLRDGWPETKILVPLDGSELAEQVLPYVADHARMSDSEVTLLRVGEAPLISADYPEAIMPLTWEEHVELIVKHHKEQCRRYLADVEKRLKDMELKVKSEALLGDVAQQIIEYATSNPFNLIAMTCHGRVALAAWPIGSVAGKVLHETSSPILLVRPH